MKKNIFLLLMIMASTHVVAQDENLAGRLENFYNTMDPNGARSQLLKFSDAELESVFNEYKNGKSTVEQRKLWLISELEARKADRIAGERLFYLFLAVVLLVVLILSFSLKTYQLQKKVYHDLK